MAAAASLTPAGTIRPVAFATLFGLLAATGMRISEALALRLSDITDDGLVIEKTKFKKSRLLPLHPSTRRALAYPTAITVFLQLTRSIGLRASSGRAGPRIHDLRHTSQLARLSAALATPPRCRA